MIDVFVPDKRYASLRGKRQLQCKSFHRRDGTVVHKEILRGYDPGTCLLEIDETYRIYAKKGKLPREIWQYKYRLLGLSKEHWEDILASSGFIVEAIYGDYSLNPYIPLQSPKMLVVATPCKACGPKA